MAISQESNGYNFFASCPRGLEGVLANEIKELHIKNANEQNGGVQFRTSKEKAIDVLISSRVASRVFIQLFCLEIFKAKDLYAESMKIDWARIFSKRQTFKINTLLDTQAKFFFKNSLLMSQFLKDGIVDQFRKKIGERPSVDTKKPNVSLLLRVESSFSKDKPWKGYVLLDMCGDALSNRGNRRLTTEAPLRENLAAGIILKTDWNPKTDVFIDTMCGSGTLLIEAALMKADIPPSYLKIRDIVEKRKRPWSFLHHKWFVNDASLKARTEKKFLSLYNTAMENINKMSPDQIFGIDLDNKALGAAKSNIKQARIKNGTITLEKRDATTFSFDSAGNGIVICNPPYGERLGKLDELEKLYYDYGENLKKNYKGYRAYIFTGNPTLRKKVSLQTSQRIKLYNGNIECRLLKYELY